MSRLDSSTEKMKTKAIEGLQRKYWKNPFSEDFFPDKSAGENKSGIPAQECLVHRKHSCTEMSEHIDLPLREERILGVVESE